MRIRNSIVVFKLYLKATICTLGFLPLSFSCFSQIPSGLIPNVVPNAPNASSLHKFEDYSVNLYSGVPDISIPLYEIDMGNIKVPITLRYHPSGIKVSEKASWVGLGWALDTGGEITRRLMGNADEGPRGYLTGTLKNSSDIDLTYPNPPDLYFMASVASGDIDTQPDIFSYDFPGRAGKFFLDGTDEFLPKLMPFAPLDIDVNKENNMSFTIRDALGYEFNFGENYRDRTQTSNGGNEMTANTAWKLEKISSPNDKEEITYTYTTSSFMIFEGTSDAIRVDDNIINYSPSGYSIYQDGISPISRYLGVFVTETKVSEIHFPNGKIVFELSPNNREDLDSKKLDKIIVYNKDPQGEWKILKEVKFDYTYFIQGSDNLTKRLRLDKVDIKNKENKPVERYSFQYENLNLPRYTSKSQDYWGYFNGKDNNTLIPRMVIDYVQGTNTGGSSTPRTIGSSIPDSRESVEEYMKASTLKRITYPTGGFSEFDFESNRYMESGEEKLAGGLRIKSIKSSKGLGDLHPLVKTYEYNSSRPNFHLSNYLFQTSQTYYSKMEFSSATGSSSVTESKRVRNFIESPTIDIVPYDGVIVSYPKVTEYVKDGSQINGRTVYEFRDFSDIVSNTQTAYVLGRPVIISKFYNRGQLSGKTFYSWDSDSDTYTIQKKISNTYSAFNIRRFENVGLVAAENLVFEGNYTPTLQNGQSDFKYTYGNYLMESKDNYLTSTTEIIYDNPDSPLATTAEYHYDNIEHQQITRQILNKSDGNREISLTTYPLDYNGGATFLNNMNSKNMKAYPIEEVQYEIDLNNQITIEKGSIKEYQTIPDWIGKVSRLSFLEKNNKISLANFKFSNTSSSGEMPFKGNSPTAFDPDEKYVERVDFDLYDEIGNLQSFNISDGITTTYLWGHDHQYLIAKIENASKLQIAYALGLFNAFELSSINESDLPAINSLRFDPAFSGAMITTYTYEPLVGVTGITDPRGETVTFRYDDFNRLKEVRDSAGRLLSENEYRYATE